MHRMKSANDMVLIVYSYAMYALAAADRGDMDDYRSIRGSFISSCFLIDRICEIPLGAYYREFFSRIDAGLNVGVIEV